MRENSLNKTVLTQDSQTPDDEKFTEILKALEALEQAYYRLSHAQERNKRRLPSDCCIGATRLHCGHIFGFTCIEKWVHESIKSPCCPLCRTDLSPLITAERNQVAEQNDDPEEEEDYDGESEFEGDEDEWVELSGIDSDAVYEELEEEDYESQYSQASQTTNSESASCLESNVSRESKKRKLSAIADEEGDDDSMRFVARERWINGGD
jgi:hypothetical protein